MRRFEKKSNASVEVIAKPIDADLADSFVSGSSKGITAVSLGDTTGFASSVGPVNAKGGVARGQQSEDREVSSNESSVIEQSSTQDGIARKGSGSIQKLQPVTGSSDEKFDALLPERRSAGELSASSSKTGDGESRRLRTPSSLTGSQDPRNARDQAANIAPASGGGLSSISSIESKVENDAGAQIAGGRESSAVLSSLSTRETSTKDDAGVASSVREGSSASANRTAADAKTSTIQDRDLARSSHRSSRRHAAGGPSAQPSAVQTLKQSDGNAGESASSVVAQRSSSRSRRKVSSRPPALDAAAPQPVAIESDASGKKLAQSPAPSTQPESEKEPAASSVQVTRGPSSHRSSRRHKKDTVVESAAAVAEDQSRGRSSHRSKRKMAEGGQTSAQGSDVEAPSSEAGRPAARADRDDQISEASAAASAELGAVPQRSLGHGPQDFSVESMVSSAKDHGGSHRHRKNHVSARTGMTPAGSGAALAPAQSDAASAQPRPAQDAPRNSAAAASIANSAGATESVMTSNRTLPDHVAQDRGQGPSGSAPAAADSDIRSLRPDASSSEKAASGMRFEIIGGERMASAVGPRLEETAEENRTMSKASMFLHGKLSDVTGDGPASPAPADAQAAAPAASNGALSNLTSEATDMRNNGTRISGRTTAPAMPALDPGTVGSAGYPERSLENSSIVQGAGPPSAAGQPQTEARERSGAEITLRGDSGKAVLSQEISRPKSFTPQNSIAEADAGLLEAAKSTPVSSRTAKDEGRLAQELQAASLSTPSRGRPFDQSSHIAEKDPGGQRSRGADSREASSLKAAVANTPSSPRYQPTAARDDREALLPDAATDVLNRDANVSAAQSAASVPQRKLATQSEAASSRSQSERIVEFVPRSKQQNSVGMSYGLSSSVVGGATRNMGQTSGGPSYAGSGGYDRSRAGSPEPASLGFVDASAPRSMSGADASSTSVGSGISWARGAAPTQVSGGRMDVPSGGYATTIEQKSAIAQASRGPPSYADHARTRSASAEATSFIDDLEPSQMFGVDGFRQDSSVDGKSLRSDGSPPRRMFNDDSAGAGRSQRASGDIGDADDEATVRDEEAAASFLSARSMSSRRPPQPAEGWMEQRPTSDDLHAVRGDTAGQNRSAAASFLTARSMPSRRMPQPVEGWMEQITASDDVHSVHEDAAAGQNRSAAASFLTARSMPSRRLPEQVEAWTKHVAASDDLNSARGDAAGQSRSAAASFLTAASMPSRRPPLVMEGWAEQMPASDDFYSVHESAADRSRSAAASFLTAGSVPSRKMPQVAEGWTEQILTSSDPSSVYEDATDRERSAAASYLTAISMNGRPPRMIEGWSEQTPTSDDLRAYQGGAADRDRSAAASFLTERSMPSRGLPQMVEGWGEWTPTSDDIRSLYEDPVGRDRSAAASYLTAGSMPSRRLPQTVDGWAEQTPISSDVVAVRERAVGEDESATASFFTDGSMKSRRLPRAADGWTEQSRQPFSGEQITLVVPSLYGGSSFARRREAETTADSRSRGQVNAQRGTSDASRLSPSYMSGKYAGSQAARSKSPQQNYDEGAHSSSGSTLIAAYSVSDAGSVQGQGGETRQLHRRQQFDHFSQDRGPRLTVASAGSPRSSAALGDAGREGEPAEGWDRGVDARSWQTTALTDRRTAQSRGASAAFEEPTDAAVLSASFAPDYRGSLEPSARAPSAGDGASADSKAWRATAVESDLSTAGRAPASDRKSGVSSERAGQPPPGARANDEDAARRQRGAADGPAGPQRGYQGEMVDGPAGPQRGYQGEMVDGPAGPQRGYQGEMVDGPAGPQRGYQGEMVDGPAGPQRGYQGEMVDRHGSAYVYDGEYHRTRIPHELRSTSTQWSMRPVDAPALLNLGSISASSRRSIVGAPTINSVADTQYFSEGVDAFGDDQQQQWDDAASWAAEQPWPGELAAARAGDHVEDDLSARRLNEPAEAAALSGDGRGPSGSAARRSYPGDSGQSESASRRAESELPSPAPSFGTRLSAQPTGTLPSGAVRRAGASGAADAAANSSRALSGWSAGKRFVSEGESAVEFDGSVVSDGGVRGLDDHDVGGGGGGAGRLARKSSGERSSMDREASAVSAAARSEATAWQATTLASVSGAASRDTGVTLSLPARYDRSIDPVSARASRRLSEASDALAYGAQHFSVGFSELSERGSYLRESVGGGTEADLDRSGREVNRDSMRRSAYAGSRGADEGASVKETALQRYASAAGEASAVPDVVEFASDEIPYVRSFGSSMRSDVDSRSQSPSPSAGRSKSWRGWDRRADPDPEGRMAPVALEPGVSQRLRVPISVTSPGGSREIIVADSLAAVQTSPDKNALLAQDFRRSGSVDDASSGAEPMQEGAEERRSAGRYRALAAMANQSAEADLGPRKDYGVFTENSIAVESNKSLLNTLSTKDYRRSSPADDTGSFAGSAQARAETEPRWSDSANVTHYRVPAIMADQSAEVDFDPQRNRAMLAENSLVAMSTKSMQLPSEASSWDGYYPQQSNADTDRAGVADEADRERMVEMRNNNRRNTSATTYADMKSERDRSNNRRNTSATTYAGGASGWDGRNASGVQYLAEKSPGDRSNNRRNTSATTTVGGEDRWGKSNNRRNTSATTYQTASYNRPNASVLADQPSRTADVRDPLILQDGGGITLDELAALQPSPDKSKTSKRSQAESDQGSSITYYGARDDTNFGTVTSEAVSRIGAETAWLAADGANAVPLYNQARSRPYGPVRFVEQDYQGEEKRLGVSRVPKDGWIAQNRSLDDDNSETTGDSLSMDNSTGTFAVRQRDITVSGSPMDKLIPGLFFIGLPLISAFILIVYWRQKAMSENGWLVLLEMLNYCCQILSFL